NENAKSNHLSMNVFFLVMLSTVTFDGFKETPLWGDVLQWLAREPLFHPLIRGVHELGFDFHVVLETVMLTLFPVLFLLIFMGFSWLTRLASGRRLRVSEIAGIFAFSLVPIAIAYHLAHYLSYLLIAGQFIIPLASDPFGIGWNLFGTADYAIDISIIGAKFVWFTAVIAIVLGHVIAIGVAHIVALNVFATTRAALRSQYPFLVLMVGYTMVSLWILSQPIVGSPSLSMLPAPTGSASLAPFEFREWCVDMTAGQVLEYDFRSDKPVDFEVHYHDGLSTHIPVALAASTDRAAQFVPDVDQSYCLMWFNQDLVELSLTYKVTGP
ncbi:MAG: hypothetical protein O2910_07125, partial [Proteobacteria bacterium]|nr:hypothetical protein [Pseudomonadota bacterium]